MERKKIWVLSGTRADYGLLKPTLKRIEQSPGLELQLAVVGMHLSAEFGLTIEGIEKDGFEITSRIETLNEVDSGRAMAEFIGKSVEEVAKSLDQNQPEMAVLLGDRAEMLAGAVAAVCLNIPIVHIHGGDESGSVDEYFRQAITKLAQTHLVTTEESKRRVVRMGEDPDRVFVVGSPGLEGIFDNLWPADKINRHFGLDPDKSLIILAQHSVVTEPGQAGSQMKETFEAIGELEIRTVVIFPNADAGGREIIRLIEKFAGQNSWVKAYKSLPRVEYLSLLKRADVLVGNSSSGIIEAPSFGLPAVNIGSRQKGRERVGNVVDVDHDRQKIKRAIEKVVGNKELKEKLSKIKNPYYRENTSEKIVSRLQKDVN